MQFNSLLQQLNTPPQMLHGTLKITCSEVFGNRILSPVFAEFAKCHPNLILDVEQTDQNLNLITAGFDLAIRIGQLDDSSLITKPLSLNKRILCASPRYIAQAGEPQKLEDLAQHKCILQKYPKGVMQTWIFIQDQQLIQILPHIQVQSTAIYAVIPHRNFVPAKVHAFIQHLEQHFQNKYKWFISPSLS